MDREAFKSEVATHMTGIVTQVETFFATPGGNEEPLDWRTFSQMRQQLFGFADDYATLLEEPSQQEVAAQALVAAMFGDEEPPESFWRAEAGRAVALAIGYPRDSVPRPLVAVILGLSRQRIKELIDNGRLIEAVAEDGKRYVSAQQVRAALRARVSGA